MGDKSKSFGSQQAIIDHRVPRETRDLRADVEKAFVVLERRTGMPSIGAIATDKTQQEVRDSLLLSSAAALSDVTLTARVLGASGLSASIAAGGGNYKPLYVSHEGSVITIHPQTGNAGALLSTAADVVCVIEEGAKRIPAQVAWGTIADNTGIIVTANDPGGPRIDLTVIHDAGGLVVAPAAQAATGLVSISCKVNQAATTAQELVDGINAQASVKLWVTAALFNNTAGDNSGFGLALVLGQTSLAGQQVQSAVNALVTAAFEGVGSGVVDTIGVDDFAGAVALPGLQGIADDAATLLTLIGSGFEGDRGRDHRAHVDAAGVNASFDIYGLNLGYTGLTVTIEIDAEEGNSITREEGSNTIVITRAAGTNPGELKTAMDADADTKDLLAIVPRGNGGVDITLDAKLVLQMAGGGADYYYYAGGDVDGRFTLKALEPGEVDVSIQILDDVTNANRYLETKGLAIIAHTEVGVTTAAQLKTLFNADASAVAMACMDLAGTGSTALNVAVAMTELEGAPVSGETGEVFPTVVVGAATGTHTGANYTTDTGPPSNTKHIVSVAHADVVTSRGAHVGVVFAVDGRESTPFTLAIVDSA